MTTLIQKEKNELSDIEQVVLQGDLSPLKPDQRVIYYRHVCESVGLNPLTGPFAYIKLNGKLTLYAKKDCTDQLRKIHGVSIEGLDDKLVGDIYIVTAKAKDKTGRIDQSKGAVVIGGLKGDALANAIMKTETKAKRRVTLSICGLGVTDESELDSIPGAQKIDIDYNTGEIKEEKKEIEYKPEPVKKITIQQAYDLQMIFEECSENYRNWFMNYMKQKLGCENLQDLPEEMFEDVKSVFLKRMSENHQKQKENSKTDEDIS